MDRTIVNFDGACEPNPHGLASWAFIVREDLGVAKNRFIHSANGVILADKRPTNNVAEYFALGHALKWLRDNNHTKRKLVILGDSQLVIKQVQGEWECNAPHLVGLRDRCIDLLTAFEVVELKLIPREENEQADHLTRFAWETAAGKPFPERPTRFQRRAKSRA